ncbi:hypothetical protein FRB95_001256 [Tulasnella sp. JGI-2019a]|nr:hypothetical protein FRB95_001256 [Tulasnella sp. JGI-2019a]
MGQGTAKRDFCRRSPQRVHQQEAITIDNLLFKVHQEEHHQNPHPPQPPHFNFQQQQAPWNHQGQFQSPQKYPQQAQQQQQQQNPVPPPRDPNTMVINGQGCHCLSEAERKRRCKGRLCMRCRDAGHFAMNCNKPGGRQNGRNRGQGSGRGGWQGSQQSRNGGRQWGINAGGIDPPIIWNHSPPTTSRGWDDNEEVPTPPASAPANEPEASGKDRV